MSVRKRRWRSPDDGIKEAWVVDYTDANRRRHMRTFADKGDADAYHAIVAIHHVAADVEGNAVIQALARAIAHAIVDEHRTLKKAVRQAEKKKWR